MADFIPYTAMKRTERVNAPPGVVLLPAERWCWLVEYIRENYSDEPKGRNEITVFEATRINSILFLPAIYRPAQPPGAEGAALDPPKPTGPTSGAYQAA